MMLSQNMVDLIKNAKQQAFEIQAMMGYKPMSLSENIAEVIKNQSSKPLKFTAGYDGIQPIML